MQIKKYTCPCCGYRTLENKPPGSFDICSICYWEDDNIQFDAPHYKGGANLLSLYEARRNFLAFGASNQTAIHFVRELTIPEEEG